MNLIKTSLFLLTLMLILSACNKGKIEELQQKNAQLSQVNHTQDSLLNDFMSLVNNFEENLDIIKQREQLISTNAESDDPEFQQDRKTLIMESVSMIDELILHNGEIIDSLSAKIEGISGKNRQLYGIIARYKNRMEEKAQEITSLQNQLGDMNLTVTRLYSRVDTLQGITERLASRNESQEEKISELDQQVLGQNHKIDYQTNVLNTAYYTMGSSRELKANSVLKNAKNLASEFNPSAFTQIDITEMSEIPLSSKKAKLMTQHPADSYALIAATDGKSVDHLSIKDAEQFWSTSKYLVIVTK